jgi:hypothetical protein
VSRQIDDRNRHTVRRVEHSPIIRSQTHGLILTAEKLYRSQVNRIECPHGKGEGLEGARHHGSSQLEQSKATEQEAQRLAM